MDGPGRPRRDVTDQGSEETVAKAVCKTAGSDSVGCRGSVLAIVLAQHHVDEPREAKDAIAAIWSKVQGLGHGRGGPAIARATRS